MFIALGIMQPAVIYYLPQIIGSVGGLPEGAVIEIPLLTPGGVLAESLSQLGTLGVLVLVLSAMGTVVAERNSGAAAMLLVKPVSFGAYLSAKWSAYNLLMLVSVLLSQMSAWYYTTVLFGPFPIGVLLASSAAFAVWISFILTALIFASVFFRSVAAVAFATLAVAVVLAVLGPPFGSAMDWSPSNLSSYASELLTNGTETGLLVPLIATFELIGALLLAAITAFKRRQLAA